MTLFCRQTAFQLYNTPIDTVIVLYYITNVYYSQATDGDLKHDPSSVVTKVGKLPSQLIQTFQFLLIAMDIDNSIKTL